MAGSVFFSSVRLSRLQARSILDGAFNEAQKTVTQPLTVVVLDGGGHLVAAEREDGCAPLRFPVAQGKAFAALGNGVSSGVVGSRNAERPDRKSTRLNSSHVAISYAVFCLKKTKRH